MSKLAAGALLDMLAIDRAAATPIYLQLDSQIREAVLSGALAKGDRMPATRQLAKDLGISRLTVQNTYDQLVAEGFLNTSVGAGTFVAEIPAEALPVAGEGKPRPAHRPGSRLSHRGREIARTEATTRLGKTRPFRPGVPAAELFPMKVWSKLWSRALAQMGEAPFGYGPLAGYPPLRRAIATHLKTARGVNCTAEQVIVTGGAQQAFALTALALLDPGDIAWGEYPGHTAGRDALSALGAAVQSIPVDAEGLDLEAGQESAPAPRLIFVTPSHQHPLGVTMSLRRRLALLKYAEAKSAWILEDDYDSEFRYAGRPLPALQGLDGAARVIYTGSFSKVLFPSIRLGYLVVPPDLVEAFIAAQTLISHGIPLLAQRVVADFMENGNFATHIRKMRVVYAERQALLLDSLRHQCAGLLEAQASEAGMHLMAWLPEGQNDGLASRQLWDAGIETVPLSVYCQTPYHRQGLLLGFTGVRTQDIAPKVEQLAQVLSAH